MLLKGTYKHNYCLSVHTDFIPNIDTIWVSTKHSETHKIIGWTRCVSIIDTIVFIRYRTLNRSQKVHFLPVVNKIDHIHVRSMKPLN
jgi:hypothetical protein